MLNLDRSWLTNGCTKAYVIPAINGRPNPLANVDLLLVVFRLATFDRLVVDLWDLEDLLDLLNSPNPCFLRSAFNLARVAALAFLRFAIQR
jgi:hypothetical protein